MRIRVLLLVSLTLGIAGAAPAFAAAAAPARPPVVMVVFEEFSLVQLLDAQGHIDARQFPNFAALAAGATFYRNFTAVGDDTPPVMAAMLTGEPYRRGVPALARYHPRSLFTLLGGRGYGMHVRDEGGAFCPRRLCPRAFQLGNGRTELRYLLGGRRLEGFRRWVRDIRPTARPMLHFEHSLLPHLPLEYFPDGRLYRQEDRQPPSALTDAPSFGDPWLVDQTWQRELLQVRLVDRMLGELIAHLRAIGLYDRAELVVTADNGQAFGAIGHDGHQIDPATAVSIASTPFIVKAPGQRRGRVADRRLRTFDVLPTIARVAGLRVPWRILGRPAGGRRDGISQTVTVFRRHAGPLHLSLGAFERGRAEIVRRKLARFGGDLLRIGPYRELVGRPVSALRAVGSRRLRARLDLARRFRAVSPRAAVLPALVTGTLSGAAAKLGLPLAVAVNGRIAATGWDSALRGHRGPSFSILLPEDAFANGPNAVQVFALRTVRGRPLLVRAAAG